MSYQFAVLAYGLFVTEWRIGAEVTAGQEKAAWLGEG